MRLRGGWIAPFFGVSLVLASIASVWAGEAAPYQKGWNFICWYKNCVDWEMSEDSVARLKETGASHMVLVDTWWVLDKNDSVLKKELPQQNFEHGWKRNSYTDEQLLKIAGWAHKYELKLVLKPHVEIIDEDQTFRGFYNPSNRDEFFKAYIQYFTHMLDVLKPYENDIDDVVVGTELTRLSLDTQRWYDVISKIRVQVPKRVKLTYASNWFDFYGVQFWDQLDWIGIDAYYPLSFFGSYSLESMISNWKMWVRILVGWRDRNWANKPIGFTETGFVDNAGSTEFSFASWKSKKPIDEHEQAAAFKATLEVAARIPNFRALYWWVWDIHHADIPADRQRYQTTGRASDSVLKSFWKK